MPILLFKLAEETLVFIYLYIYKEIHVNEFISCYLKSLKLYCHEILCPFGRRLMKTQEKTRDVGPTSFLSRLDNENGPHWMCHRHSWDNLVWSPPTSLSFSFSRLVQVYHFLLSPTIHIDVHVVQIFLHEAAPWLFAEVLSWSGSFESGEAYHGTLNPT